MTLLPILLSAALASGGPPDFVPPPGGIGCEYLMLTVRGAGMGGVEGCYPEPTALSYMNPSTSAWAANTGLSASLGYAESDLESRDGRTRIPGLAVIFPVPGGITLTGGLAERSSFSCADTLSIDGFQGDYSWEGGTGDGYFGLAVRANPHLSFSLGSRFLFGNLRSDILLSRDSVGTIVPLTWKYRDDLYLRPAWGVQLGTAFSQGPVSFGASFTTDRTGNLELERDFISSIGRDTTQTETYTIPGEGYAGLAVRPVDMLQVGVSYFRRKTLNLLGSKTDEGEVLGFGAEAGLLPSFSVRAGVSSMSGLWRDGATTYGGGLSYTLPGNRAVLDVAVTHEVWDGNGETSVRLGFWGSERWR